MMNFCWTNFLLRHGLSDRTQLMKGSSAAWPFNVDCQILCFYQGLLAGQELSRKWCLISVVWVTLLHILWVYLVILSLRACHRCLTTSFPSVVTCDTTGPDRLYVPNFLTACSTGLACGDFSPAVGDTHSWWYSAVFSTLIKNSIPRCGICSLQNVRRHSGHSVSFLLVVSENCNNFTFILGRLS